MFICGIRCADYIMPALRKIKISFVQAPAGIQKVFEIFPLL